MTAVAPQQQLPRNALVWIIIAQFTLVAPHWQRLPIWVLGLYLVCALWRTMVYRGRWDYPPRWVKALLACIGVGAVYLSFGSVIGLEPTVALLLTAFALKLLELATRKDAYVVLFLGYFVCVTQFLFSQELLVVIYTVLPVLMVTTALVALHQPEAHAFQRSTLRFAGVLLLQSVPMMLVLFFFFPRIGPLWSVPLKSHSAQTGVSDFMKPGDISNLSQSADVAFRVQFEGEIPPRGEMYWRGLVMSRLEEGAWRTLRYGDIPVGSRRAPNLPDNAPGVPYSIILEPTQQRWLYGLRLATTQERKIISTADYVLYSPAEIQEQYRYSVVSYTDATLDASLPNWRRRIDTALPEDENPQALALAADLRRRYSDDEAMLAAVLKLFREQPFVYTLQPELLSSSNSIDDFLFNTRRGFCEHYASAFVMLMRAAGIPARVVAGYQGGEVNPVNRTVIVHQFDAHAWAEVWLPNEGWRRVDPTAAVSPDRIEFGLEQAMASEGSFLSANPLSPLRFRGVQWVNRLRLRYDALIYSWQSFIVGYDRNSQYDFLERWLGEVSVSRFLQVIVGSAVVMLLGLWLWLTRKPAGRVLSPAEREFLRFSDALARQGLARQSGEAPGAYAKRAAQALPELAPTIIAVGEEFEALVYTSGANRQDPVLSLQKSVTRVVRAGRWGGRRQ